MSQAVAIDFGASSGRYALGEYRDGVITFEVIEQIAHAPHENNGRLEWDLPAIVGLCNRAVELAEAKGARTVGIDSWGVDHGFLDADGKPMGAPVCYRDTSHLAAFELLKPYRAEIYARTGIQHQPFNTICQLLARRIADPSMPDRVGEWMILPDYLAYLLTGERNHELTQASTTQLLGLDGNWSPEEFELIGWPLPSRPASLPGQLGGLINGQTWIAHVGSHDTASAVAGFGYLAPDEMFLNVGTWSLGGCVIPYPIATPEAEALNFTNERTVDGQVRFLKNVPGFYVVNRLHEELAIQSSVPAWLGSAVTGLEGVDLLHPDMFNPDSMVEMCVKLAGRRPTSEAEWAGFALASLVRSLATLPGQLHDLTGRTISTIRVGGGGSQSTALCQALATSTGLKVIAGPAEATVLGNLGMQFLATGIFPDFQTMASAISRSVDLKVYVP